MRRLSKGWWNLLACVFFLCGIGLLFYPTVSGALNQANATKAVENYTDSTQSLTYQQTQSLLENAQEYNSWLAQQADQWSLNDQQQEYLYTLLDPDGSGVIGSIEIPSIDLNLPIYHSLSEGVLQSGVGHMDGSSLPVGGESTHCILAGHRGVPGATLFTRLDEVEVGDRIYLHVLGETLAYEVDSIRVTEPENVTGLSIEPGEDLLTLVTCTPYGVNTERLLVRAHRVEYTQDEQIEDEQEDPGDWTWLYVLAAAAGALLLAILVWAGPKMKKRNETNNKEI